MIKTKALNDIFLLVGLFLLTLVNHTIFIWSLGLAFIVAFLIVNKVKIKARLILESFSFLMYVIVSGILFQIYFIDEALPVYADAFLGNLSRFLLCILVWFCVRVLILSGLVENLAVLIKSLLVIHLGAFYVQFFLYLTTGYFIDFVLPFTGVSSRYVSFDKALTGIGSFRPTGFFVEPSTYFMCIFVLLVMLLVDKGIYTHRRLFVLTIISMYLSFSTSAVIIATVFLGYYIFNAKLKWLAYAGISLFLVLLLLIFYDSILILVQSQIIKYNSSSGIRFELVSLVLDRTGFDALFGSGFFAVEEKILLAVSGDYGVSKVAAFNDSGLLVYLILKFGLLGFLMFLLICFKQKKAGKHRLPFFLMVSLTKISFFHPLFMLYLATTISTKKAR